MREEGVGLVTCSAGHHSLLLDSRDYWADVLQNGRPESSRCRCGSKSFAVWFDYVLRDLGEVRTVTVNLTCDGCGKANKPMTCDIKYSPTAVLIERPLDPIDKPWQQPKRVQLTGYWQPEDLKDVATYLVETLGARVWKEPYGGGMEACRLSEIEFFPELRANLYFTTVQGDWPEPQPDPQKHAPLLHISGATHMLWGLQEPELEARLFLLYSVDYALEIVRDGAIQKQPAEFLAFATAAHTWCVSRFESRRGRRTIDNPAEYRRLAPYLLRGDR